MNDRSCRPAISSRVENMQELAKDAKVVSGNRFSNNVSAEKLKEWAGEWL